MSRKIYAAIGHFKDSENMTSVVFEQVTKKDFMRDCYGNAFVPYVVITETMLNKISALESSWDVYEQVKKMTSNYRVWNKVTEYLSQCDEMILDKVAIIKENSEQA